MLKGVLHLNIRFWRLNFLAGFVIITLSGCITESNNTTQPAAKTNSNNALSPSDSTGIPKGCSKIYNAEKSIWELNCPEPAPPSPSISQNLGN